MSRRCILSLTIFLVAAVYFAVPLSIPFFTRGEGREALVIQSMFDQQNLVLPLRNGSDIPSKPPLFHWVAYGLATVFSHSELIYRLPSVFASALTLAAFFTFFSARVSERSALLSIILLASSLDWLRASVIARVDMMFCLWAALATWLLYLAVEEKRESGTSPWGVFTLAGTCMGLAVLTKGPAGVAFPATIIGIYSLIAFPWRKLPVIPVGLSALLGTAIGSLWYLAAYHEGGDRFLDVHLMRENVARLVGDDDYEVGHKSPAIAIIPMILAGLAPWSFFIIPGVVFLKRSWRTIRPHGDLLFALVWAGFYLVFFAFTASKRNVYLLPSYPAYAFLFALALDSTLLNTARGMSIARGLFAGYCVFLAVCLAILSTMHWIDVSPLLTALRIREWDIDAVRGLGHPGWLLLAAIAAAIGVTVVGAREMFRDKIAPGSAWIAAGQFLIAITITFGIVTPIAHDQTPRDEIHELISSVPEGAPLFQYLHDFYAVDYYLRRQIPTVYDKPQLTNSTNGYILVSEPDLEDAKKSFPTGNETARSVGRIVYGRYHLVLLKFS